MLYFKKETKRLAKNCLSNSHMFLLLHTLLYFCNVCSSSKRIVFTKSCFKVPKAIISSFFSNLITTQIFDLLNVQQAAVKGNLGETTSPIAPKKLPQLL